MRTLLQPSVMMKDCLPTRLHSVSRDTEHLNTHTSSSARERGTLAWATVAWWLPCFNVSLIPNSFRVLCKYFEVLWGALPAHVSVKIMVLFKHREKQHQEQLQPGTLPEMLSEERGSHKCCAINTAFLRWRDRLSCQGFQEGRGRARASWCRFPLRWW